MNFRMPVLPGSVMGRAEPASLPLPPLHQATDNRPLPKQDPWMAEPPLQQPPPKSHPQPTPTHEELIFRPSRKKLVTRMLPYRPNETTEKTGKTCPYQLPTTDRKKSHRKLLRTP